MIKTELIECVTPFDVPDGRHYVYMRGPLDAIVKEHQQRTGNTPDKVYHWCSKLKNWEWYKVVEEK